jgi:hypothetical protein
MAECPWYVSAKAVREYMALTDATDFDDASDALIELCARTWENYRARNGKPKPRDNGMLLYRGPRPRQFRLVVSTAKRPEGDKPQLVSVLR